MRSPSARLYYQLAVSVIVAVAWVLLFHVNNLVFSRLYSSELISWFFIPAGLRLIAVLLLHEYAIAGLFIGALITSPDTETNLLSSIIISLISALNPYLAFKLSNAVLDVKTNLLSLTTQQLIIMSVMAAGCNALMHNIYFYFSGVTQGFWVNALKMFTGDVVGSLLVLYTFSFGIKLVKKLRSNSPTQL